MKGHHQLQGAHEHITKRLEGLNKISEMAPVQKIIW